jgi:hypothetical protein
MCTRLSEESAACFTYPNGRGSRFLSNISAYIFFSTLYTREFKMDKTVHRIIYGISEMNKCCEFNMQCVTVNNFCKLLPHK